MSQEKVDRYKKEKANRKQTMKREKLKNTVVTIIGGIVCVAVVGWVGYSGYNYFSSQKAANPTQTEVDLSAATDYLSELYAEDDSAE